MSDLTPEAAYHQLQAQIDAHAPTRTRAPLINIRRSYAAATPFILQLQRDRDALAGVLAEALRPPFLARVDTLQARFLAAMYAEGRYRDADDKNEALHNALTEAAELRKRALHAAQMLALQGKIDADLVRELRRGSGLEDLLEDNRRLGQLMETHWSVVQDNQRHLEDVALHLDDARLKALQASPARVSALERANANADERADWHRKLRAAYELLELDWSFLCDVLPMHYLHLGRAQEGGRWPALLYLNRA